jgi:cytochrome c-type biogenesis protein CcmE
LISITLAAFHSRHPAKIQLRRAVTKINKPMKKIHIVLLVLIAAAIAVLISFLKTTATYDTIETAKSKPGKFVHLIAKLDTREPVQYDALNNPNYLSFTAIDSLGGTVKVVYHNPKPDNLEHSDRLVLKGSMQGDHFECKEIMMKCPSKYKDDMKMAEKNLPTTMNTTPAKPEEVKY